VGRVSLYPLSVQRRRNLTDW